MKTIKGVIFDVDGTLLDSMGKWSTLTSDYLKERGIVPDADLDETIFKMTVGGAIQYVKERYHLEESEEEIQKACLSRIVAFYRDEVQLKKGARELLCYLKENDIRVMTASSGERVLQEPAFERLGVRDEIEELLFCTELHTDKSTPEIYRIAAEKMHLSTDEIVVFEDALHGVESAKSAGFLVCGVEDEASAQDRKKIMALSDWYVQDLKDAIKMICFQKKKS